MRKLLTWICLLTMLTATALAGGLVITDGPAVQPTAVSPAPTQAETVEESAEAPDAGDEGTAVPETDEPQMPAPAETEAPETADVPGEPETPDESESVPAEPAAEEEKAPTYADTQAFGIRNGPRDAKRVAVTMDDCYERERVREAFELCKQYGVVMTFFPLGDQLKAKDASLWREIVDYGCEIGSHTMHHTKMTKMSRGGIATHLYRFQECLDEVLGYHYGVVSVRPPFGAYRTEDGRIYKTMESVFRKYGFDHIVLWDVSQTDAEKAKKDVKNGSILLYHARVKDVKCLRTLIPWLVEQGYELVTVRELLEYDEIEISPEIYNHKNDPKE